MSQRNKSITSTTVRLFERPHPTQQEIDAYVREAQRLRAQAVADLLRGLWRAMTGRRRRDAGARSFPAKA